MSTSRRSAFTMIEMVVVLSILALLVGVVVGAKNLIESAELRSITSDAQKYMTAVADFRDKFNALPGDFPTATAIWGTATGCPNTQSSSEATCNGSGNSMIADTAALAHEGFHAWQQMDNAGLITGKYTGAGTTGTEVAEPGVNVPPGAMENSGYSIVHASYIRGDLPTGIAYNYHAFIFGAPRSGTRTDGPLLTIAQASTIDRKIDDGMPATGTIIQERETSVWPNCISGTTATATYKAGTSNANACTLIYTAPF